MGKVKVTKEILNEIIQKRKQGWSYGALAEQYKVGKSTVHRLMKPEGLDGIKDWGKTKHNQQKGEKASYNPQPENMELLDYAMAKINEVPYRVSSRWVFYQLVQAGFINKKDTRRFVSLLSRARKKFLGSWRPDTLADSIRECYFKGEGWYSFDLELNSIEKQNCYVQLWFEAEAMHEQFEYYTKNYRVSLIPFRGDVSIPIKWKIAKKIEEIASEYQKPIKILYFGDCDPKGKQIYSAALKDIKAWCNVNFDVERIGLTLEQAKRFGLPENPERANMYQWEALSDKQAAGLILGALNQYYTPVPSNVINTEDVLKEKISHKIREIIDDSS